MQKKLVTIAIVVMFTLLMFSGCDEQKGTTTSNDNPLTVGMSDTFSVDSTGGQFSLLDDNVEVHVDAGSVSEQVNITVESISNPVTNPSLVVLSCLDFGPDGLIFETPIDVTIHYNIDDIPAGVEESAIKVYVLDGNTWEAIEGSYANVAMHYAVATVSHFSQIACCIPAPASEDTDEDSDDKGSDDDSDNTSAQYWFKANLYFYNHKTLRVMERIHEDTYKVGVSAYWDPVPYVQYYQIKFEFHGNPPQDYAWSCDHRDQGKDGCLPMHTSTYEGYIYQLGGDPHNEGFIGSYDGPNVATIHKKNQTTGEMEHYVYGQLYPDEKHGFGFRTVSDTIDDYEGLSAGEIGSLVNDMQEFLHDYVDGWEVWVRGVTERGD